MAPSDLSLYGGFKIECSSAGGFCKTLKLSVLEIGVSSKSAIRQQRDDRGRHASYANAIISWMVLVELMSQAKGHANLDRSSRIVLKVFFMPKLLVQGCSYSMASRRMIFCAVHEIGCAKPRRC